MFSCEFCEISKNTFFHRTPPVASSVFILISALNLTYNFIIKTLKKTRRKAEENKKEAEKVVYKTVLKLTVEVTMEQKSNNDSIY